MTTKNWTQIATQEYNHMDTEAREQWSDLRNIIDHLHA